MDCCCNEEVDATLLGTWQDVVRHVARHRCNLFGISGTLHFDRINTSSAAGDKHLKTNISKQKTENKHLKTNICWQTTENKHLKMSVTIIILGKGLHDDATNRSAIISRSNIWGGSNRKHDSSHHRYHHMAARKARALSSLMKASRLRKSCRYSFKQSVSLPHRRCHFAKERVRESEVTLADAPGTWIWASPTTGEFFRLPS